MNLESDEHTNKGRGVGRFLGLSMREVSPPDGPVTLHGEMQLGHAVLDADGALNAGALFTMIDCIGGFCGGLGSLPDGWVVTTSLHVRSVATTKASSLRMVSSVLRKGKSSIVTTVDVRDDNEHFVSRATVTSAILLPVDGVPAWTRPAKLDMEAEAGGPRFADWIGAVAYRGDDGRAGMQLELVDELRNPWGIMHGGVTTALVDAGAREVVGAQLAIDVDRLRTTDVVMHFLSPARTGPVSTTGRVVGERPDGTVVEIDVVDHGNSDRLVAFAVATVAHLA